MAEIAKGIIDIEINTGGAASQLQALQTQINAFNLALNKSNKAHSTFAKEFGGELQNAINKTGLFTAETIRLQTAASTLDKTLSKGRTSLGQFFSAKFNKNSAIAAETMALAAERAKRLQTQFIATSGAANGFQDALAVRPLSAFSSQAAVAAQKTQILSNMFKQGTTQLINFGKNVQWAGRQLMVGFTVPLTIFGAMAGKTFMELEKQGVAFKKVYGDIFTTPAELNKNLEAVKGLASEYTKYGIAVKDTISLAAQAAAAGRKDAELTDAVSQATRLATLGQMDQNAALETTISLQSAFRLSGKDLADTINFLNMVENQTVVSLQDISAAIPRVAPVIQGLGGDVKDLTVFLAAMQEGGVDAAEGANALKSGLASLINPTKQATEMLNGMGINLETIIQANRGDLMGTVRSFAEALQGLDQFSRQQALEQVFGKFQYAKLGALFENISREGSQAQQVIATMGYSTEQLGATADKELKTIEESFGVQLTGAVERFKLAIAPIGEIFVKLAIPLVNFATKIVEGFNGLSDTQKRFTAIAAVIVGVVIPAVTMMAGLFLNLVGTLAKIGQGMALFGKGFLTGGPVGAVKALTQSSKYLSLAEMDAAMAAQQLSGASQVLNTTLIRQVGTANAAATAIANLTRAYSAMASTQAAAGAFPAFGVASAAGAAAREGKTGAFRVRGLRRNSGGSIPGSGNTDTVPAMLTPGEFVINKDATKENLGLLKAINGGSVKGYNKGGIAKEVQYLNRGALVSQARSILDMVRRGGMGSLDDAIKGAKDPKLSSLLSRYGSISRAGSAKSISTGSSSKTFAHMDSNTMNAKTPEGKQFFDNLYETLLNSGALVGHQKTTWAYGKANGWNGWRVTGGTGFNLSKQTTVNGNTFGINSKLNTKEGVPANVLLDDLLQNFSKGGRDNPYLPMLRRAGIKDGVLIENISQKIHSDVVKNLSGLGQKTITDQKIYPDMTRIIRDSIGSTIKDSQLKEKALSNLSAGLQVRTGNVPKLKDPNELKGTQYSFQALLKRAKEGGTDISDFMPFFLQRNKGGEIPGSGNSDTIPTMLTPGEFVVNKKAASQNQEILEMMNGGQVKGYADGGIVQGEDGRFRRANGQFASNAEIAKFQKGSISSRIGKVASSGVGRFAGSTALGVGGYSAGKALTGGSEVGGIIGSIAGPLLPKAVTALTAAMGISTAAFVGVTAPLALAGFAVYALNKQINKAASAGADMTKAMYGTAKSTEEMAKFFGKQTYAQASRLASVEKAYGSTISEEAQAKSLGFVQSDPGKQLLKDVASVKNNGGDAVKTLRNQLSAAIISGAIGMEEANAIALEVGNAIGDQKIAVQVSGELNKLLGPDGRDILKNLSTITAEISPRINSNDIASAASYAYDQLAPVEQIFTDLFKGGKSGFEDTYKLEQISADIAVTFRNEANALELLSAAYKEGSVKIKDFVEQRSLITNAGQNSLESSAKTLGFENAQALNAASQSKGTIVSGGRAGAQTVFTGDEKKAKQLLKEMQDAYRTSLEDSGMLPSLVDAAMAKAKDFDFTTLGMLASNQIDEIDIPIVTKMQGDLSPEDFDNFMTNFALLKNVPNIEKTFKFNTSDSPQRMQTIVDKSLELQKDPEIVNRFLLKDEFSNVFKSFGINYDKFANLDDISKVMLMQYITTYETKDASYKVGARGGGSGENRNLKETTTDDRQMAELLAQSRKNKAEVEKAITDSSSGGGGEDIQTLQEYLAEFRKLTQEKQRYLAITLKYLGTAKMEAVSLIDQKRLIEANAMIDSKNNKIKKEGKKILAELIKLAEQRLSIERATAFLALSTEQKILLSLEMQEKALDVKSQADNKALADKQREIVLNNRALDDLAEKEDAVNKTYDEKLKALDKIATANDRIGEQERSRIGLASALASGDIAAAASAVSEIQQAEAQYQIEDTRAALEAQRERDLESLTVSVNGQLLTREQIQARNKTIADQIEVIEDRLYAIEKERSVLAEKRASAELRTYLLQQKQTIEALKYKQINEGLTKDQKAFLGTLTLDFNNLAKTYNDSTEGSTGDFAMQNRGGYIARMANGGIAYKGSREAPPALRMHDGFTVPGNGMTDKVPALLTPGEFVVRKSVADKSRGFLEALNGQVFPGMGGAPGVPTNNFLDGIGSPRYSIPESGTSNIPVASTNVVSTSAPMYNSTYNVNVNVSGTNASPDDIANVVMAKLSQQNRGNLRSSRY